MIRLTLFKARKNVRATPRYVVNSTMKNNNIHNKLNHAISTSSSAASANIISSFCNNNKINNTDNKTRLFYTNQNQYYQQQPFLFKVHNRPFVSTTDTKEDTEKGKGEEEKETEGKGDDSSDDERPAKGGFFSNLYSEIKQELEKNEDLKKNLEQLSKIKDSTEKKANEYKPTEKNIEDATEAAKEAQKKLDEAAELAKKKSEDIYKKAEAAKDSFSKSWKNVTDTINEKAEKIEEDSESVREAKKKAFGAAENARKKAEKIAGTSSFQTVTSTVKEILKEGKDDIFGADKETRKERREKTKKMRERRAERRDARREKERLAKEAAIKKEQGGADGDNENETGNNVKATEWAEAVDEDSGDTYYYNVKTGETTWDKPEGYDMEGGGTVEDENNSNVEGDHTDNSDGGNDDETYIVIDEAEAKAYFDGFDTDNTGSITEEQFDDLVDEIAERRPDLTIPQTRIDVLGALEVIDPDAKGTVKLENYLQWIEAYTSSGGKSHGEQIGGGAIILRGDIETAWQRVGERLRKAPLIDDILGASEYAGRQFEETDVGRRTRKVRERVSNIREDALEVWETSQNPWVYRFASAYDGLTGETEQGQAIKELRRLDPAWDLLEWLEEVQDEIAPALLKGYLEGDNEIIDYYCVDQASALIKATIKDNKLAGKIPDPAILDLRGVELLAARVLQRAPPILVVKFNAQQLDCIRNNKGEVIEGSDDQVTNNFYYAAMQRNWDEEAEELRWHVLEFQIIGKLPWN